MKIQELQGQYRWLSNFWFCIVKFDGEEYPTVENAYQAAKVSYDAMRVIIVDGEPKNVRIRELIRKASPGEAKRWGRKVKIRPDWEEVKVPLMKQLLREKFKNSYLQDKLLHTRDFILEEGNHWKDNFWGICPPGSGQGQNVLGKLLMEVREEIKNNK